MFNALGQADALTPTMNIGGLLDLATGKFVKGIHGEYLCNGGLWRTTAIAAGGNGFKTGFLLAQSLIAMKRYRDVDGVIYETESSLNIERIASHGETAGLPADVIYSGERLTIVDLTTKEYLDEFWGEFKKLLIEGTKTKPVLTTPFINPRTNAAYTMKLPTILAMDSVTAARVKALDKEIESKDEGLGEKGRNMEGMHDGRAKTQMLAELPGLTARNSLYMLMTAHTGEDYQLDPNKPLRKRMQFMRQGLKFRGAGAQFMYIPNTSWLADGSQVLINQSTKEPEYPEKDGIYNVRDADISVVEYVTIRNKGNESGFSLPLIFSQSEGFLPWLSEFHYVKINNRFGLGGNDRNYYYELMPEEKLGRTTVRDKLRRNEKLRTVAKWTADMCQMQFFDHSRWLELGQPDLAQLYTDIKERGYDWEILYNTRPYWVFEEHAEFEEKPYLSACDLLAMAKGIYHPWWYDAVKAGNDWRTTIKGWKAPKVTEPKEEKKPA